MEKTKHLALEITNTRGNTEIHYLEATYKDNIDVYLDDEASGKYINSNCEYEILGTIYL